VCYAEVWEAPLEAGWWLRHSAWAAPCLQEEGMEVHHGRCSPIDALVSSKIKTLLDHESCWVYVCLMNL
jgi:hypothetical protein